MQNLKKLEHHNKRLIEFCLTKAYPDGIISVERLIEDNLINGPQVAELAVCRTNGFLEIHPIGVGQDLTDGSDVKTITVQEEIYQGKKSKLKRHRAQIKDVCSKIGTLRTIAYNPFFEKWIYFIIPNQYFSHLKKITISFDQVTGEPKGIYKNFQVQTWEELCQTEVKN